VANPLFYIDFPAVTLGLTALDYLDQRADNLSSSRIVDEAALDRYEFFRDAYLQRREYLVYDGNPPFEEDDMLDDDFEDDSELDEQPEESPEQ